MNELMALIRSLVFAVIQAFFTVVFAVLGLMTYPFSPHVRYAVISRWAKTMIWFAKHICGVHYRVEGIERLPDVPCLVLAKHQSAWETLFFQVLLPPQVWVLKQELLKIPFFGWGLAMTSPIAIDRNAGRKALKQMVEQGKDRLAMGFWIVMFPEGTRVPPGTRGQYHVGGAFLATQLGAKVVPIAHNAGTVWPRHAFVKHPGTITVSIGEVIDPNGMKAEALRLQVETWIEDEVERLGSARA